MSNNAVPWLLSATVKTTKLDAVRRFYKYGHYPYKFVIFLTTYYKCAFFAIYFGNFMTEK